MNFDADNPLDDASRPSSPGLYDDPEPGPSVPFSSQETRSGDSGVQTYNSQPGAVSENTRNRQVRRGQLTTGLTRRRKKRHGSNASPSGDDTSRNRRISRSADGRRSVGRSRHTSASRDEPPVDVKDLQRYVEQLTHQIQESQEEIANLKNQSIAKQEAENLYATLSRSAKRRQRRRRRRDHSTPPSDTETEAEGSEAELRTALSRKRRPSLRKIPSTNSLNALTDDQITDDGHTDNEENDGIGLQAVLRDQAATLEGLGRAILPDNSAAQRVLDLLRRQAELSPAAYRRALEESTYRTEDIQDKDPDKPPPLKLRPKNGVFKDPRLRMNRRKEIGDAKRGLRTVYRGKFTVREESVKTFLRDFVETANDFEFDEEEARRLFLEFFQGTLYTLISGFLKNGGVAYAVRRLYGLFPTRKDATQSVHRKRALRWKWDPTKPLMAQALDLYESVLLGFPEETTAQAEYQATVIIEDNLPKAALAKINFEQKRHQRAKRNNRMPYRLYLTKLERILTELGYQTEGEENEAPAHTPKRATSKERRRVNQVRSAPVRAQVPDFRPQQIAGILQRMNQPRSVSPITHEVGSDDAQFQDDYDTDSQEQAVAVTQALLQDARNSQAQYSSNTQARGQQPSLETRVAEVLMNSAYQRSPEYGERQPRSQTVSESLTISQTGQTEVKKGLEPTLTWESDDTIPVPDIISDQQVATTAAKAWAQAYRQAMQYYATKMGAKVKSNPKTRIAAPIPPAFPSVLLAGHDYYETRVHPGEVHPGWKIRPPEEPSGQQQLLTPLGTKPATKSRSRSTEQRGSFRRNDFNNTYVNNQRVTNSSSLQRDTGNRYQQRPRSRSENYIGERDPEFNLAGTTFLHNFSAFRAKVESGDRTYCGDREPVQVLWEGGYFFPEEAVVGVPLYLDQFQRNPDGSSSISRYVEQHFIGRCVNCGMRGHRASNPNCPIRAAETTWELCTRCRAGFHAAADCKIAKDLYVVAQGNGGGNGRRPAPTILQETSVRRPTSLVTGN